MWLSFVAYDSDGKSFEELRILVDTAIEQGRWLVLAGHEIGEQGRQTTRVSTIQELCRYLYCSGRKKSGLIRWLLWPHISPAFANNRIDQENSHVPDRTRRDRCSGEGDQEPPSYSATWREVNAGDLKSVMPGMWV